MTDVRALQERLQQTFRGAFQVRDVAEALASFDARMPAATALERLQKRGFAVVGVREHGWSPATPRPRGSKPPGCAETPKSQ